MIVLTVRVEAHTAQRRELTLALLGWATATRLESGVVDCHVYEDVEAPTVFCAVAEWANSHAYESHLRGQTLAAFLGALDLLALPPRVVVTQNPQPTVNPGLTLRRLREEGTPK